MNSLTYLLDTDWVIHHFNNVQPITRRIEEAKQLGLGLSVISLAELWDGVCLARNPQSSEAQLRVFLTSLSLLGLDAAICERFGRLRSTLRARGAPIPHFDILIAATALEHNLTLLSNNRKHFENIPGLRLESI